MRAIVTGGLGFIGSHVVDKLRDHGVEVCVYDLVPNHELKRDDVEYVAGSILDTEQLSGVMRGAHAVFHLAAIADVKDVYERPVHAESINVRGTMSVLEAARQSNVKQVIYGSTTWVYSDAEGDVVDEGTALHPPAHLYTATKVTGEYYCRAYSELYGLKTTVLRYGIPYGPRARDGAVVPIFVSKALKGEPLTIAGDGAQFRQFVYVEDLAEGNVKALKATEQHRIYNLDGSEKITILEIAETVRDILGDVEIERVPARSGDFSGKIARSQRALDELGWQPETSFRQGLEKYIEWYVARSSQREKVEVRAAEIVASL